MKFRDPQYIGDPINAVKIFNEKEVDEIIVLDITATIRGSGPSFKLISEIASECFMPMCYGGGIRTLSDIERLINLGVEKVALNSSAVQDISLVDAAAKKFGSQSVVVSIDTRKNFLGKYKVYINGGKEDVHIEVLDHALRMQEAGTGEIFLNNIDLDGTMRGYDLCLVSQVASSLNIPIIACGGAGQLEDFRKVIKVAGASAAAAGSMFVFQGKHRAVLITYPTRAEITGLLDSRM